MSIWHFENFIYAPSGNKVFRRTHAQLPTPLHIKDDLFRIYFSSRDDKGNSRPFFLDYSLEYERVIEVNQDPILKLGNAGCFDDSGIMPSSVIKVNNAHYLYYIGWNKGDNIGYRLSIGLAISKNGGKTFTKYSHGPILDRNIHDPIFCAAPSVHFTGSEFVMWYISCTGWPKVSGKREPVYLIKRAISQDGISWTTSNDISIPYEYDGEALGRPSVIFNNNSFYMWYSSRGSLNYRSKTGQHYTIGYASSNDGIKWVRRDEEFQLHTSNDHWDSEMQEYSAVFEYKGGLFMVYNGNGFGRDGFGLAKLKQGQ